MAGESNGIAKLGGVTDPTAPVAATPPSGGGGFVTTVQRARDAGAFETVVKRAAAEQTARAGQPAVPAPATAHAGSLSPAAKAAKANKSFETFALQTFIGSMLPKENTKLFGTGSAGKMWQSVLAEKLAEQLSASGRLKLLPEQTGATASGTPRATDAAVATATVAKPNGLQAGLVREDVAGGKTPAALQELISSLRPQRNGGTR